MHLVTQKIYYCLLHEMIRYHRDELIWRSNHVNQSLLLTLRQKRLIGHNSLKKIIDATSRGKIQWQQYRSSLARH